MNKNAIAILLGLVLPLGLQTRVRGELLFSDSFDYPAGPLPGNGPPPGAPPGQTGWSLAARDPQVNLGGLVFRHVLSAGNSVTCTDDGLYGDRAIAYLSPVNSGSVWIGFLIRQVPGAGIGGYAVVNLFSSESENPGPGFGLLTPSELGGGLYGIDNDTGRPNSRAATTTAASPTTTWLVVQLDFDAGREALYVNPCPRTNGPEPTGPDAELRMTGAFRQNGFNQVWLNEGFNQGSYQFDEVRIGRDFRDVRIGR